MWHERTSSLDQSSPNRFWEKEKEREKKIDFRERERVHLLSKFPGNWTVELRRAKKQRCSPLQELHVGTGFVEFRQLREVGVFSYLIYSLAKSHSNG